MSCSSLSINMLNEGDRRTLAATTADVDDGGGPWGNAMDVFMCLLPIMFLLYATLKGDNPIATTTSLPFAALMLFLIRLMYLASDPLLVCASVVSGLHDALAPIAIMGGAIFLFDTMDATLCMPFMLREMKVLSRGHPIAETMLLFCFAYMLEGVAAPPALGAALLASLGYAKLDAVVLMLIFNTLASVWGAVGTPIWFGFGNLGLTEGQFVDISYKAGVALFIGGALLLPMVALRVVCPWSTIRPNLGFIAGSFLSCAGLSMALSFVSYEFPSLVGGMVGCLVTGLLITFRVGLRPHHHHHHATAPSPDAAAAADDVEKGDTAVAVAVETTAKCQESSSSDGHSEHTAWEDGGRTTGTGLGRQTGTLVGGDAGVKMDAVGESAEGREDRSWHHDANGGEAVIETLSSTTDGPHARSNNGDNGDNGEGPSHEDKSAAAELLLAPRRSMKEGYLLDVAGRAFPLWGTVVLLMLTRIEQIGLKGLLTRTDPAFEIDFGTYGIFRCSASLVLQLNNILTYQGMDWKFALLYVPFILPFIFISLLTMLLFRSDLQIRPTAIACMTLRRLRDPAVALLGALVLVKLLTAGGTSSPAYLIGTILSDALGGGWVAFACLVGMLGSFFAGGATFSNLTFGGIQLIAAQNIGVSETAMLALQAAGGSAGSGVSLNNIIAACAVVGLDVGEGRVISRTGPFVLVLCAVSTVVMLAFFLRFD